jgi:hypothetical protein
VIIAYFFAQGEKLCLISNLCDLEGIEIGFRWGKF